MAKRIIRWKVFSSSDEFAHWQYTNPDDVTILTLSPIIDSAHHNEANGVIDTSVSAFVTYIEE